MSLKPPIDPTSSFQTLASLDSRVDALEAATVNVKDAPYNAACDYNGTTGTNDTVAVQAAAAALIAAGGGKLVIPGPTKVVPVSSGVVIDVPVGVPFQIVGEGAVPHQLSITTHPQGIPGLFATAAGTIVRFQGTGPGGSQRAYGGVTNLRIDGTTTTGVKGVALKWVNNIRLENVTIANCPAGGLHGEQVWNSEMPNLRVYRCGAVSVPAVKFASLTDNLTNGGCNTVKLPMLEIEESYGTSLYISGDTTLGSPSYGIMVSDFKIEGGVGSTFSEPHIDLDYASACSFVGGFVARTSGGTISAPQPIIVIRNTASPLFGLASHHFADLTLTERYDAEVLVDITGDSARANFDSITFDSTTVTTGGLRIGSSVPPNGVRWAKLSASGDALGVGGTKPVLLVPAGVGPKTVIKRTTTATDYTVLVSDELVLVTDTTAVRTITLPAAADFPVGQSLTIKDVTGNAHNNPIAITATIDGQTGRTIASAYGAVVLFSNGTAWFSQDMVASYFKPDPAAGSLVLSGFPLRVNRGSATSIAMFLGLLADTQPRFRADADGTITRGPGGSTAPTTKFASGTGSPESVLTAGVGSLWERSDGGTLSSVYAKASGAGNTGWSPLAVRAVSINSTDAAFALAPSTSPEHTIFTAVMAAGRVVTLSTTGAEAGMKFKLTRTAASTGAFNLDLGGLKNIAVSQWAEVTYNGSAWVLTAFGSL